MKTVSQERGAINRKWKCKMEMAGPGAADEHNPDTQHNATLHRETDKWKCLFAVRGSSRCCPRLSFILFFCLLALEREEFQRLERRRVFVSGEYVGILNAFKTTPP